MKNYKIIILIFLAVSLTACNALDKLTQFEFDTSTSFKVPATLGINLPFNVPTPEIKTNISEKLKNEQSNKELIEKLFLKKMVLNIKSPNSQTFRFVNNVDLYLKTDNLSRVKVAYKHNISNSIGAELIMDIVKDQDLQEYVKDDNFIIEAEIVTDELIFTEVTIEANMNFWVDAKILGL